MARSRDVQIFYIIGVRLKQIAHMPLCLLHLAKHCLIVFVNQNSYCWLHLVFVAHHLIDFAIVRLCY